MAVRLRTLMDDNTATTFVLSSDDARCFAITGELVEVTAIMRTALPSLSIPENYLWCTMIGLTRILEHLARSKPREGAN
jgi:hypothetical protein